MSKVWRPPLPDVARLVARARAGGAYTGVRADATRSSLERFSTLYRALEHLARFTNVDAKAALADGLAYIRSADAQQAIRDMATGVSRLTPAAIGSLVDEDMGGAARDAAAASLRSAAKHLAAGSFNPSDAHARREAARLLRGLRNAAVHAKLMTTDRDIGPIFADACVLLDELVVATYARAFELTEAQVTQAFANAEAPQ